MRDDGPVQQTDTLIIGGGQAGLAAGYHLAKRGLPFAIIDADARIGDHWRDRWDSLKLYSPAKFDSLPGMAFPAKAYEWPTGRQMGDYLEAYAGRFKLPVLSGVVAERLEPIADGFLVTTSDGRRFAAQQVVVATGPFRRPNVPPFADQLDPDIRQLHSHAYKGPEQLADGPVLVVGLSHSGADIALEVARAGHPTVVSGRAHGQLPTRVIDTPKARIAWPVVNFVFGHVLTIATPMGRKMRPEIRMGGGLLLRVRLPDLDAAGVERHDAKTVGVQDGRPRLADGTVVDVANVIWCTGYGHDYDWIRAPVIGPDGWPKERRGVSPDVPGLYFLGIPFSYAFSSMLVAGAGRDAKFVVDRIEERVRASGASRTAAGAAPATEPAPVGQAGRSRSAGPM